MDRKAWIAITLSVIGLVFTHWYISKTYRPASDNDDLRSGFGGRVHLGFLRWRESSAQPSA